MRSGAALIVGLGAGAAGAPAGAGELGGIVAERARAALPADLELVLVSLPSALEGIDAEPGEVTLRWPRSPKAGRFTVPVAVRASAHRTGERKGWATLVVARRVQVLVAARALAAGASIGDDDVRLDWRAVADGGGWRFAPSALVGASILTAVPAGAILDAAQVAAPAPLARGTEVAVVVSHGRVAVSTSGTLERAARLGEAANVRLASGRRVLSGHLIDARTFAVDGGAR